MDAILGPYDLAASMGRMGQVDHPEAMQAIDHVIEACRPQDASGLFWHRCESSVFLQKERLALSPSRQSIFMEAARNACRAIREDQPAARALNAGPDRERACQLRFDGIKTSSMPEDGLGDKQSSSFTGKGMRTRLELGL